MELKIGDKVKMRDRYKAETHDGGVWGVVGEVVEIVDDGTSIQRVTVEFPDHKPIVGMVAGQLELAWSLTFPDPPFAKTGDDDVLAVWLQGRDEEAKAYVEIRVIATALTQHCGAEGLAPDKLVHAFEKHREKIVVVATRKYEVGNVETMEDRIVVYVGVDDL